MTDRPARGHDCVPECYEDQSEAIERGHWEDPRPRYRVIAAPWYDHEGNESPDHPSGLGHDSFCAAGYSLEIWVRHPDQPPPLGTWRTLGATQTDTGGVVRVDEIRALVIDYVQTLAQPLTVNPDPARIEVYVKVEP